MSHINNLLADDAIELSGHASTWREALELAGGLLDKTGATTPEYTAAMIKRYQNGIIGPIPPASHDTGGYREALKVCRFDKALEEVWDQIRGLNQYIEEEKPWQIFKTGDADNLRDVLARQVSDLLQIAELLEPFLPETAKRIQAIFEEGVVRLSDETLFPRIETE